jgi:hypothetical protein
MATGRDFSVVLSLLLSALAFDVSTISIERMRAENRRERHEKDR